MASLSLKHLNKIYSGNVQAVFDFSIDIKDKEFIVFVGPSGCGKSTTLRMIAGLEDISSGELYIDNEYMNNTEPKDRNIAMVFQSYALYPHMTVYDNIKFALKLRKTSFPIYEKQQNPEITALMQQKRTIKSEIRKVLRKSKKANFTPELRKQRDTLYKELYDIINKINSLKVQKVGIDEYQIYLLASNIDSFTKILEKNKERMDKKPEEKESLESKNEQLEKSIKIMREKLEYLSKNQVPLSKLRKPSREEMDIEINKVAEQIDLVPYLLRKPAALSGGQRQRVALGRAMVRKPKVFLMDEPLSNLDAKLRVQTRNEIKKLHKGVGATTIYVTHDQIEAMTMADRIVIMKDGYIQQIGTPHEVFNNPQNKFVAGFIGSSPMNFIKATCQKGNFVVTREDNKEIKFKIANNIAPALKDYEGKEVILGIRPSDIYLDIDKEKTNPSMPINCVRENVELIGNELIVHTNLDGLSLMVKTRFEDYINCNEEIAICLDTEKLFVFNAEDEKRIG